MLQQQSLYSGNGGSFNVQHGAVDNSVYVLPLYSGISTGYSGLNGSSNLNQSPNVPGSTGFNSSSGLNQSGMGQPVGWDQIEYPTNPGDAGAIANFHNDELITGFDFPPMVNYASNSTSTPRSDAPFEYGVTAGNNYLGGNPGFIESPWDASACLLVPSTQIAASGSLGWSRGGGFASALTALTTPTAIDEGRPMTDIPTMQPDTIASLSQTGRTPLHPIPAGLSKRRQKGRVSCPEGCGTILSRRQDIDRHLAQKHAEATLRCPVGGCIKRFSRHDKRSDHLKKGHKLGAKDINMLSAVNLGGEEM